ncbi:hypothetical protein BC943DRAFT_326437 [Umbelopsis sp. AD052]|nr:hypothetical protein BC943DRAFT_326437 [Umbelopsis sp. AD052]
MTTSSPVWFQGPVAEAVTQVNAKGCVFVVFARDESPESDAMSATLEADSIVQRLREQAIAITLEKDTDNANLFGQLYPVHRYPSLFLLKAGAIVEVITGSDISSKDIASKFDKAVAHTVTQPPAPQQVARPAGPTNAPAAPVPTGVSSPSTSAQTPPTEKKEALRKKLELARKKRAEEEEKNQREKEIQRRRTGQEIQAAQESHDDKQRRKYAEEVKKERKAEEEHRRQLREQIESDKRERAAQRQREIEERQKGNATPLSGTESTSSSATRSTSTVCNISVRQMDGSQIRKQFNATDTLDDVMKWIDAERTDGDAPFMLLAQFPTRQFSMGDESKSLRELELVPSSTLIMKPPRKVTSAYTPTAPGLWGYAYSAADLAYSAAGASWNMVNTVLATLLPASGGITGGTTLGAQSEFGDEEQQGTSSSDSKAAAAARRNKSRITTLDSLRDDDKDPKQTYNGNSINQE